MIVIMTMTSLMMHRFDKDMLSSKLQVLLIALMMLSSAKAGPLAYAACQSSCNAAVAACYAGAGLIFGTVTAGLSAPIAAIVCNLNFGSCIAACAPTLVAPTP